MQNPSTHRAAIMLADNMMIAPSAGQFGGIDRALSPAAAPYARDFNVRTGLVGAMSFIPSQNPAALLRTPNFIEPRTPRADRFDPGSIALPATRTLEDHLLTGFVAVMLIAYQLRRKHRFLRPHQFST